MLAVEPGLTGPALAAWSQAQGRKPRAILVVSPHWMGHGLALSTRDQQVAGTISAVFRRSCTLQYAAPGSPELAARAQALLADAGIAADRDPRRPLDHGAWVPLPVSRGRRAGGAVVAGHGARRRRAARTGPRWLRDEDVLIIGSGSLTHNLRDVRMPQDAPPASYVPAFQQWYAGRLADHDRRRCWTGRRGRRARRRPIRMTIT